MRLLSTMGALAILTASGTVYAQNAEDETSNDNVTQESEEGVSPNPDKEALKDGTKVAQAGQGRRGANNGQATDDEEPDSTDEPEEKSEKLPARVPWRGTAFSWGHSATAGALGIGGDFQGSDYQSYTQSFSLGLNYFVIDKDKWSLAVASAPSFTVEMTNSAATTRIREPWMNDLPTSVVYRRRLYSHDELPIATGLVLNSTILWPTSPASYNAGTYLTTSPRVVLWQSFPVIPKDVAPVLNSIAVGVSGRWNHRFGESNVPVNDSLRRPRQNLNGDNITDNTLSGNRVGQDNIREGAFIFLVQPIGPTQLVLFAGMGISQIYRGGLTEDFCLGDDVLNTGEVCGDELQASAEAVQGQNNPDWQFGYDFSIGGQFFPVAEAGVSFGYSNGGNQLGLDGQRQNIAYNPRNAMFSAGLVVSLDAIYEGITGPRRASPFVLVAENEKKKRRDDRKKTPDKMLPTTF